MYGVVEGCGVAGKVIVNSARLAVLEVLLAASCDSLDVKLDCLFGVHSRGARREIDRREEQEEGG